MEKKSKYKTYKKHWPRKNLGNLLNFLERIYPDGLSIYTLAKDFEMSPQAVSNLFLRDDMKLSKAEEIARLYGHTLHLYYPKRSFNADYQPRFKTKDYPNAGNLSGLIKYINDSEYSLAFVAERISLYPGILNRAFENGDILLSVLNNTADALGIHIFWDFTKENKEIQKETSCAS